ncbi:MAG TPA: response regulator [Chloroflexi bacterium]|nr:response regulator [Chloroflexota bacterium]
MPKILIAEDEPDIRDLLVFTLQYGGFEVIATSNGFDAIRLATSEQPDMILLDVRMPKMTGYEACKTLKNTPATADIPVVFLSAKGQEAEVQQGLETGAMDYILKPFAPDALIARIQKLLENAGQDKDKRSKDKTMKSEDKGKADKKVDKEKVTGAKKTPPGKAETSLRKKGEAEDGLKGGGGTGEKKKGDAS